MRAPDGLALVRLPGEPRRLTPGAGRHMTELRRVGLNLLFLVPGETGGMEVYVRNLVPRLAEESDYELVAFVNREAADLDLGGVESVQVDVSGRGRTRRVLAEQRRLPKLIRQRGLDLLHSMGSSAPWRPGVLSVVTVHDVIYARFPNAHTRAMRTGQRIVVPRAARSASRVITVSEAAAGEIAELLRVPRDRIDVIQEAGKPIGPSTPEGELRRRLEVGAAPIVLSVSARRPHKNLPRLLAAFARLESQPPPVLVLPGYPTAFESELEAEARRLGASDRVRFLDWVSDRDLEGLYAAAVCFVFPSLAEGFGLPVLEAMQRGVPVACSSASALPEVGGEAVRYFDPFDTGEIASALSELLGSTHLRERLAAAGRRRADTFSWQRAARETAESYERAWAASSGAPE
jgi:glycosyltransferase involved in cell wall biosynthesis